MEKKLTKSWVPKGKLIKHMRKTSMGHKPRTDAKNACKIDKATYQCNLCDQIIYEGKSQKNFEKLQETYPDIIMDKFHMDHIQPVVCPKTGWIDWNTFIERLFCGPDGWQGLCPACHDEKTRKENEKR